jgi:NAD(P)-dependent dehydrogenase (short-subunit alcohol dehydrogenase family)
LQINDNTVALVTGGASGLGEATVRRLHTDGASVVIVDLPTSAGAELAAELGDHARFAPADVRDEGQVQAAIDGAAELGTLRVVVTCAGVGTPGRVVGKKGALPLETFRNVIDINLVGTFNVLRLAAAAMLENEPVDGDRGVVVMTASIAAYDGQVGQAAYAASKGGVVGLTLSAARDLADKGIRVMTASIAAYDGQVGQAAYAASKGGVVGLTLSAARDLADKGIRVMTVAPGTFMTPMLAGLPPEATAVLEQQVPHPSRLGDPVEYASLVRHIVDNPMLNGEVIRLDGALRMPPR